MEEIALYRVMINFYPVAIVLFAIASATTGSNVVFAPFIGALICISCVHSYLHRIAELTCQSIGNMVCKHAFLYTNLSCTYHVIRLVQHAYNQRRCSDKKRTRDIERTRADLFVPNARNSTISRFFPLCLLHLASKHTEWAINLGRHGLFDAFVSPLS